MSDRSVLRDVLAKVDGDVVAIYRKIANVDEVMVDIQGEMGRNAVVGPLLRHLKARRKDLYRQLDNLGLENRKA